MMKQPANAPAVSFWVKFQEWTNTNITKMQPKINAAKPYLKNDRENIRRSRMAVKQ